MDTRSVTPPHCPTLAFLARLAAVLILMAVPASAGPAVCNATPPGYAWQPDLAGIRTPEQLAALVDQVARWPADGPLGIANASQSNGRETFTNLVRKLTLGTPTTPAVSARWRFANGGKSLHGIEAWATTHDPDGTPTELWDDFYAKLSLAGLMPRKKTVFVTTAPALAIVRYWAVGVSSPVAPADMDAWRADRRAKIEKTIRILHEIAPNALIELTGQDTPQYAMSRDPLARPWNVAAEDALLEQIARDGVPLSADAATKPFVPRVNEYGVPVRFRAITYLSRLTDGETPRLSLASASFPNGLAYPCSWFKTDKIHLLDGEPGKGYDRTAQSDVERWFADPVFSTLWEGAVQP